MDTSPFLGFSSNFLRLFFSTLFLCTILQAKLSTTMLDSILLINLGGVNELVEDSNTKQRRSLVPKETLEQQIGTDGTNTPPVLPESITSHFESSHGPPLVTNDGLTEALREAFSLDGTPPTIEDFEASIKNLAESKQDYGLSNKSFLSSTKSMISAYLRAGGDVKLQPNLSTILFSNILPKTLDWGGHAASWIKSLAQISVESLLEEERSMDEFAQLSSSFASTTVDLIHNNPYSLNIDSVIDPLTLSDRQNSGLNFAPTKTQLLQQLSVGITQGFFAVKEFNSDDDSLTLSDFEIFSQPTSGPNSANGGVIETNVLTSFYNGLIEGVIELEREATQEDIDAGLASILGEKIAQDSELFLYEAVKASANGFLLATTVVATSKLEYLDEALHLDIAEKVSRQISQSVLLHDSLTTDGTTQYTISEDWIEVDRVAESAALGAAMGSQLATVLPKSLEYTDSWEVSTNIRREISKSVARGSSSGSVNSAAWLGSLSNPNIPQQTVLNANQIEKVARGSSLGSMMGNTGLAIYYPTEQLVPIINLTAQGSAYGSTNAGNLSLIKPDSIETIDVGVARQSALGSAMGAIFEPTVLLGLNPALNSNEKQTVDHLTAASFGATFGAILGLQANDLEIISRNGASQFEESRVVEVQQATKQGSIEGALAGAKLSLGLDNLDNGSLKSKTVMLKAVNNANTKAAANSTSNTAAQALKTNSQDMLLLMKKFGINPRFTNPAKMYKRPVVVQVDDPPIDDDSKEAINNASPL
jgi:hypothetical protein